MTQVAPTQSGHISLFTMPCTWWRGSVCRMTSSLLQAHSETKPWTYKTRKTDFDLQVLVNVFMIHTFEAWDDHRSRPKLLCSKPLKQRCELIWTVWVQMDWMMPTSDSSVVIVLWHEHDYWPRAAGLVHALTITQTWIRSKLGLHLTTILLLLVLVIMFVSITYNNLFDIYSSWYVFHIISSFVLHDCGTSKENITSHLSWWTDLKIYLSW